MTVADENGKDATSVCIMLESIFPSSIFRKGTEAYREEAQGTILFFLKKNINKLQSDTIRVLFIPKTPTFV